MKRNHLNSLAHLTLEKRQLGQQEGEWDTFSFPLKQPLSSWRAMGRCNNLTSRLYVSRYLLQSEPKSEK